MTHFQALISGKEIVMEIDHHKEQNSSPETSQTCTTRLGSLHQKLPRHVQHVWVDKMGKERSTLLKLCAGITVIRRRLSCFSSFCSTKLNVYITQFLLKAFFYKRYHEKNICQDENIPPQSPPNQLLSARHTNSQLTTINSQLTTNNSQLTTNNSHSSPPTTINKQSKK